MGALMKVLIVDDSQTNRSLLKEMLKGKVDVAEAEDGLAAWKLYSLSLEAMRYDLLLLDIAMPRMDGIKLLNLIRENENSKDESRLPVLIISAQTEKIDEAKQAGCDDYLLKPISMQQLYEKIYQLTHHKAFES